MKAREYKETDCMEITKLFYNTVHNINSKDYTKKQLNVWATEKIDVCQWNKSFLENKTIVVTNENIIVGFGDAEINGYINRLYVHKDFQRRGVGTIILRHFEELFIKNNLFAITVKASITAMPFFENFGYVTIKENVVVREGVELINFTMEKLIKENC